MTISDDFTRASLGANWTVPAGASQCGIVGGDSLGMAAGAGSFFLATWTGTKFFANQWCEAQISPSAPPSDPYSVSSYLEQLYVRCGAGGGPRYGFGYDGDPLQVNFGDWIFKYDGVPTPQTRVFASTPALVLPVPGDTLRLEIVGYTLKGYLKQLGSSNYVKVLEGTDTDVTKIAFGSPGLAGRLASGGGDPLAVPTKVYKSFSGDSTMTVTPKRLAGPALLSNAAATKYTCPAATIARILRGRVSNTSGVAATFTISMGADAAGTRLYDAVSVPANGSYDFTGPFVLAAGEIVQAFSGTNNVLMLELDGTEST